MKTEMKSLVIFLLVVIFVLIAMATVEIAEARPIDMSPSDWHAELQTVKSAPEPQPVVRITPTAVDPTPVAPTTEVETEDWCDDQCEAEAEQWANDLFASMGFGIVVEDFPLAGVGFCSIGSLWNDAYSNYSYFTNAACLQWAMQYVPPAFGQVRYCRVVDWDGSAVGVFFNDAPGFQSQATPPFVEC